MRQKEEISCPLCHYLCGKINQKIYPNHYFEISTLKEVVRSSLKHIPETIRRETIKHIIDRGLIIKKSSVTFSLNTKKIRKNMYDFYGDPLFP